MLPFRIYWSTEPGNGTQALYSSSEAIELRQGQVQNMDSKVNDFFAG